MRFGSFFSFLKTDHLYYVLNKPIQNASFLDANYNSSGNLLVYY